MPATSAKVVSDSTAFTCCLKRARRSPRGARGPTRPPGPSSSASGAQVCTKALMSRPPPLSEGGAAAAAGDDRSGGATLRGTSPARAGRHRPRQQVGGKEGAAPPPAGHDDERPAPCRRLVTRADEAVPSWSMSRARERGTGSRLGGDRRHRGAQDQGAPPAPEPRPRGPVRSTSPSSDPSSPAQESCSGGARGTTDSGGRRGRTNDW